MITAATRARDAKARRLARRDSQDLTVSHGRPRIDRTSLGIALLHRIALPEICYTQEEIAAWAGCTDSAIAMIEFRALKKLRRALRVRKDPTLRELMEALFNRRQPAKPTRRR